jgi:DNA-directed RNA polymerase specialized sigma24 family protein
MTAVNVMVAEYDARGLHPAAGQADFNSRLESVLPAAFRAALELLGDATDAERLVEAVAVAAWARFGELRSQSSFRAWFLGILASLIQARGVEAAASVTGTAIDRALAALPVEVRVATTLHLVGELSYEELGSALGIPAAPARARVRHGRALLCLGMEKAANRGGPPGRWH